MDDGDSLGTSPADDEYFGGGVRRHGVLIKEDGYKVEIGEMRNCGAKETFVLMNSCLLNIENGRSYPQSSVIRAPEALCNRQVE